MQKVAVNTRSCQKVVEKLVESPKRLPCNKKLDLLQVGLSWVLESGGASCNCTLILSRGRSYIKMLILLTLGFLFFKYIYTTSVWSLFTSCIFLLIAIITCADITCKENQICHEERPKAKCIKGKPLPTIFRVVSRKQLVHLSCYWQLRFQKWAPVYLSPFCLVLFHSSRTINWLDPFFFLQHLPRCHAHGIPRGPGPSGISSWAWEFIYDKLLPFLILLIGASRTSKELNTSVC